MEMTTADPSIPRALAEPSSAADLPITLECSHCPWKRTAVRADRLPRRCPNCGTRLLDVFD